MLVTKHNIQLVDLPSQERDIIEKSGLLPFESDDADGAWGGRLRDSLKGKDCMVIPFRDSKYAEKINKAKHIRTFDPDEKIIVISSDCTYIEYDSNYLSIYVDTEDYSCIGSMPGEHAWVTTNAPRDRMDNLISLKDASVLRKRIINDHSVIVKRKTDSHGFVMYTKDVKEKIGDTEVSLTFRQGAAKWFREITKIKTETETITTIRNGSHQTIMVKEILEDGCPIEFIPLIWNGSPLYSYRYVYNNDSIESVKTDQSQEVTTSVLLSVKGK